MRDKKKIFILHGWAYTTERWKTFIGELEKGGVEVEMLKIPGLTAPLNEVWDVNNYVDWLNKSLNNEKTPVILLGHSNGGLISLAFSLKYPEKVKQLFLMDSTGIYHNEFSIRLKRTAFMVAAKIGKKLTDSSLLKKLIYKIAGEHDYEKANKIAQKTMVNLIKTDLEDKLSEIKTPTIIIWGEKDQITPVSDGEMMREKISNSSLHIISEAKHSPHLTHPKETAEVVMKNIKR